MYFNIACDSDDDDDDDDATVCYSFLQFLPFGQTMGCIGGSRAGCDYSSYLGY